MWPNVPSHQRYLSRLTVVPRHWFLDQVVDCRIFQKKTTGEILETRFVSRIMQEDGCFYFVEHSEDDHTLVISGDDHGFARTGLPRREFSPGVRPLRRLLPGVAA